MLASWLGRVLRNLHTPQFVYKGGADRTDSPGRKRWESAPNSLNGDETRG